MLKRKKDHEPPPKPSLEPDFIYVLSAVNRHGQRFLIDAKPTQEETVIAKDLFLKTRKGSRYWTKNGEIKTAIEKKPV